MRLVGEVLCDKTAEFQSGHWQPKRHLYNNPSLFGDIWHTCRWMGSLGKGEVFTNTDLDRFFKIDEKTL